MSEIHIFRHRAMATEFQVRIANRDQNCAAPAAHAAFALADQLESCLSRFRAGSDITQLAQLAPAESLRVSEPVFACLKLAQRMETATRGAFSVTAAALQTQPVKPRWSLLARQSSVRCDAGKLEFDLGAIGKGFALDRMAALLRERSCPAFLLVAGGSSILAGEAPASRAGWDCGLGVDHSSRRHWLVNSSLSGSGLAVKGEHILNPRTGLPSSSRHRAWALTGTAAESDALSTACMILDQREILGVVKRHPDWLVFLSEQEEWRQLGRRPAPPRV